MAHLSDDSIYSLTFEHAALAEPDLAHLATCADCQARAAASSDIAAALRVARASRPSDAQRAQLHALASMIQTQSTAQRFVGWVRAQLAMDTRTSALASGMRGTATVYRLLYSAPTLDVELMIEPANGARSLVGALLTHAQGEASTPALVQLEEGAAVRFETETASDGRFRLGNLVPGRYQMRIVQIDAPEIVVDNLEIS